MRVMAYWNSHRKLWSLKSGPGGRVTHARSLALEDVAFRVRQGGRRRCLREKRKNVHAFACGIPTQDPSPTVEPGMVRVSYRPAEAGHFIIAHTGERLDRARRAVLLADGRVFARP